jgi:hypothetical protein
MRARKRRLMGTERARGKTLMTGHTEPCAAPTGLFMFYGDMVPTAAALGYGVSSLSGLLL